MFPSALLAFMGTLGHRSPQNAIIFPHAAKLYLSHPHAHNHSECVKVAKILFQNTLLSFYEAFLWQQTSDSKFITPLKVECLWIKSCGPQMCKPFCIHITHFSHSSPFFNFVCFQINSAQRTPGFFPQRAAGDETEQRGPAPSPPKGEDRICRDMLLKGWPKIPKMYQQPPGLLLFVSMFTYPQVCWHSAFLWLTYKLEYKICFLLPSN